MSVREEDRQKNCPSRGLGIAAAAIGVGVGAALYYFFSKRNEPDASGSTTNWTYDDSQELLETIWEDNLSDTSMNCECDDSYVDLNDSDDREDTTTIYDSESDTSQSNSSTESSSEADNSYTTVSEYTTSDTSIHDSNEDDSDVMDTDDTSDLNSSSDIYVTSDADMSFITSQDVVSTNELTPDRFHSLTPRYLESHYNSVMRHFESLWPRTPNTPDRETENIERMAKIREQAFRERTWTVEECSICFEPMQREHEVMSLPCSHRFHQPCILPWLQERQTCPYCRKEA